MISEFKILKKFGINKNRSTGKESCLLSRYGVRPEKSDMGWTGWWTMRCTDRRTDRSANGWTDLLAEMHECIENLCGLSKHCILCTLIVLPKLFQRDLNFFLNQCKCHVFNNFFHVVLFHLEIKEFHIWISHEVKYQSLCSHEKRARFICRVHAPLNSFTYCSFIKKLNCET